MPNTLTSILVMASLAWVGVLTYHELRQQKIKLEKQTDDKAKKKEIRKKLAEFLLEGNQLDVIDQSKEPINKLTLYWLLPTSPPSEAIKP